MFRSKSLWIFQTVCFHLDGYDVVTWDHGQTQNSGLSLGECVCNHRRTKQLFFLIYHLIMSSNSIINVQNYYCEYYSSIYTKVPFIWFNFIYRAPYTIKLCLGALLRTAFILHKSKKKMFIQPVDLRNSWADPRMTLQSRSVQRNSPTRVRPSVIRILMFLFRSPSSFCLAWNDEDTSGCSCKWTERQQNFLYKWVKSTLLLCWKP